MLRKRSQYDKILLTESRMHSVHWKRVDLDGPSAALSRRPPLNARDNDSEHGGIFHFM